MITYGKVILKSTDPANPCGLIAKYFFSDSFKLYNSASAVTISIDETGIAHNVDKTYKFKSPTNSSQI